MFNLNYSPITDTYSPCLYAQDSKAFSNRSFCDHTWGTSPYFLLTTQGNAPGKACSTQYPKNPSFAPYGLPVVNDPNILYLIPGVLGTSAGLIIGFGYFGHSFSSGYTKFIFFLNIFAIIVTLGAGAYIFQLLKRRDGDTRFYEIIPPLLLVVFFFALAFHTLYSLYPDTFSGTIGDTPVTQFISFLSLSIGSISVGETFNITPEKSGAQFLAAIESFWNLFVLSLLISFII